MVFQYFTISRLLLIFLAGVLLHTAIADNRCFLEGGGSAESFFISEDLPVDSVVGTLGILGDPDLETGDIELGLRERDSPVKIAPGTRILVLASPVDKEGVEGPSSVYVNVICDRKLSNDPSFVIPVNIRVTDANDNAPQWVGAPYALSLSEVTVPGTRVLQGARAIDADQNGPYSTVEYSVLPGPYSEYFSFITPLEGTLLLRKSLDFETMANFSIGLRAQDQGTPPKYSDTVLQITVTDADDQNPKFLDEAYTTIVPENIASGTELITLPRPVAAVDQDVGLRAPLVYSLAPPAPPEAAMFTVNPRTGALALNTALQPRDLSQPVTLVLKATQVDNPDRYALATLIVSREGSPITSRSLAFMQATHHAIIPENTPIGSRIVSLNSNRPGDRSVHYVVVEKVCRGLFGVSPMAEVLLRANLDYEIASQHRCHILASDGRNNATTLLNITVTNVNDWEPRFRYPHYEFFANSGTIGSPRSNGGTLLGRLEAADGDRGDVITLTLRGPHSNLFTLDNTGTLLLKPNALSKINTTTVHLVATVTDSGVPPRASSVPLTIHFPGALLAKGLGNEWGLMSIFAAVLGLFAIVIIVLSIYIYKVKKPKPSRNRIHTSGFMHKEKAPAMCSPGAGHNGSHLGGTALGGSESTISAGASTIIANSLERGAQADYTATVRSIMSRASINRSSQIFDGRGGSPSPEGAELTTGGSQMPGSSNIGLPNRPTGLWTHGIIPTRVKKLSWGDGDDIKNDESSSTIVQPGSQTSENTNLTVYF